MNFFQRISTAYTPSSIANKGETFALRDRILQTVLLIAVVFGLPLVILASWSRFVEHSYALPLAYLSIYSLIVFITITRELPYNLRANGMTLLIYALSVSELFESGQIGEVRMFLMAYIALTAVLFNIRFVVLSLLLSLATIIGASVYAASTPHPIGSFANVLNGTPWMTSSVSFMMLSLIISGAILMIISGLDRNLKKQAELMQKLEHERDLLEDHIQERTQSLAHGINQLRTAADIGRAISGLSESETLLQRVADLIQERFELYYVGIFILDQAGRYAVLQAGTGEPGKRMMVQSHQLAVGGSSMIGWSIANRKSRIALDVGVEAVRFNNPNLPLTRSELALPIMIRERVLGAMSVQSEKPNAFDESDITILESIADSLAIALENDRLYQETRESLEEIRTLNREYLQRVWAEAIETYGELSYQFENPAAAGEAQAKNAIEVPLVLRDEVIGQITLEIDRQGLSEEEKAFVENVTTQTAIALENARLLNETERRAIQEKKLNELAAGFSRALSIDEILRVAAQELGQLPAVAEVSVQLNPVSPSGKPSSSSGLVGGGNGKEHAS